MIQPAAGVLLIAEPFLKDPNFLRTVILLTEHHEDGTVGFVLNREAQYTLDELVPEMTGHPLPVFYGGPVQGNTLHFLHCYPNEIPESVEVGHGIWWGGDFEEVMRLIKTEVINLDNIRFYMGYSGWSSGQLAEEMAQQTWLTAAATKHLAFHPDHNLVWKDALKHLGGDYEHMIHYPIDPQLN